MNFTAYADRGIGALGITLRSCGHIFAQKGRRISRPTGREDWLLFYVAKGCELFSLKCEVPAEAGSFILFRPGEKQEHICVSDKTAEFYYIHFFWPDAPLSVPLKSSTVYTAKPSAAVCTLFEELIQETQLRLPEYGAVAVGKLLTLLGTLARSVTAQDVHTREYMDRIAFVLTRMHKNYAAEDTLESYAEMCRMSKYHFLRVFRDITGVSPIEYRNRLRLEHAKELLLDTALPISEIGARVGYSSPTCFSDAFKKRVGVSPRSYRESDGKI